MEISKCCFFGLCHTFAVVDFCSWKIFLTYVHIKIRSYVKHLKQTKKEKLSALSAARRRIESERIRLSVAHGFKIFIPDEILNELDPFFHINWKKYGSDEQNMTWEKYITCDALLSEIHLPFNVKCRVIFHHLLFHYCSLPLFIFNFFGFLFSCHFMKFRTAQRGRLNWGSFF